MGTEGGGGGTKTAMMIMWETSTPWNMDRETVEMGSDLRTLVPLDRDLMVSGADRRLILFLLSYLTNKSSFHKENCGTFRVTPIFLGKIYLCGGQTSKFETTVMI